MTTVVTADFAASSAIGTPGKRKEAVAFRKIRIRFYNVRHFSSSLLLYYPNRPLVPYQRHMKGELLF